MAISFSPGCPPAFRSTAVRRAAAAISAFGQREIQRLFASPQTVVLSSLSHENFARSRNAWLVLHGTSVLSMSGVLIDAPRLLLDFEQNAAAFQSLEPPFLAISATRNHIVGANDAVGLGNLFLWQGKDCAAIATSASALAKTFECAFDHRGMFQQMTVGHRLLRRTAFEDIDLTPPGSRVILRDGRHRLHSAAATKHVGFGDQIEDGRDAILAAVARCLNAEPQCAIELSGGLDSRMILAAIPSERRVGRTAYTIGYSNSADVQIARSLAKDARLDHKIIDLRQFDAEAPDHVWQRARKVAYRDDFSSNVIDRLAINCVDDMLINQPRLSGINGEFSRGFYYPAMPIETAFRNEHVSNLLRWRLMANDAAPRELFRKEVLSQCYTSLENDVKEALLQGPPRLGETLDRFYLFQRMRHWAGNAISGAMTNRIVLVPFFHSNYISWSMEQPVAVKRDSLAFCKVLRSLDSRLARVPLDSGIMPATLARGGFLAKASLLETRARKLGVKLQQRFAGSGQQNLGSEHFSSKLACENVQEWIDWSGLKSIGLFEDNALDRLRFGNIPWTRTTIGYIFNLHFQIEYLKSPMDEEQFRIIDIE
jgi:asparagine synthase (glutamine-hydrolysing)